MAKAYSVEERKSYCANWGTSGVSKIRFCKENKISGSALHKWLKLYGTNLAAADNKEQGIKFLNIEPVIQEGVKAIEIVLPNGLLLRSKVASLSKLIQELWV